MEHHITIFVKDSSDFPTKEWYNNLRNNLPSGILSSIQEDEKTALLSIRRTTKGSYIAVPLIRDITENEFIKVSNNFTYNSDYKISATKTIVGVMDDTIPIEIDENPIMEICEKWEKEKHDIWMKQKVDSGWNYGTTVSEDNKTHPLLRPWADLPKKYKKVDTSKMEEMLEVMNKQGYVLIKKTDIK